MKYLILTITLPLLFSVGCVTNPEEIYITESIIDTVYTFNSIDRIDTIYKSDSIYKIDTIYNVGSIDTIYKIDSFHSIDTLYDSDTIHSIDTLYDSDTVTITDTVTKEIIKNVTDTITITNTITDTIYVIDSVPGNTGWDGVYSGSNVSRTFNGQAGHDLPDSLGGMHDFTMAVKIKIRTTPNNGDNTPTIFHTPNATIGWNYIKKEMAVSIFTNRNGLHTAHIYSFPVESFATSDEYRTLVLVQSHLTTTFYIDGNPVPVGSYILDFGMSGQLNNSTLGYTRDGNSNSSNHFLTGSITTWGIFDRDLTPAEIGNLNN